VIKRAFRGAVRTGRPGRVRAGVRRVVARPGAGPRRGVQEVLLEMWRSARRFDHRPGQRLFLGPHTSPTSARES